MQIDIQDILIKEIIISKNNDKFAIGVWYSLIDSDGNEIQQKRDLIIDETISDNDKTSMDSLLSMVHDTLWDNNITNYNTKMQLKNNPI